MLGAGCFDKSIPNVSQNTWKLGKKKKTGLADIPLGDIAETKILLVTPNVIPGTGAQRDVGGNHARLARFEQPHLLQLSLWDQMQQSGLAVYGHEVLFKGSVKKENVEVKRVLLFQPGAIQQIAMFQYNFICSIATVANSTLKSHVQLKYQ